MMFDWPDHLGELDTVINGISTLVAAPSQLGQLDTGKRALDHPLSTEKESRRNVIKSAAIATIIAFLGIFMWNIIQEFSTVDTTKTSQAGINTRCPQYLRGLISVDYQDTPIRSVLAEIPDFADMNLVASDKIDGQVTMMLEDVPWDEVLAIVAMTNGLKLRITGRTIMIGTATDEMPPLDVDC